MSRAALALAVCLSALLSGCGGVSGPLAPDTSTPTADAETPVPTPTPPARLTRERGVAFARQHERALVHNEHSEGGAAVEVSCEAWADRWVDRSLYVVTVCGGSVGDDADAQDSFHEPPALYRLDGTDVQRVPLDDSRAPEMYRAPARDANVDDPRSVAMVNFAAEPHAVSLTVTHLPSGETALDVDRTIAPAADVTLQSFLARSGTYRVVARLDDGTTVRYRWRVTDASRVRTVALGVYVTDGGSLSVETLRAA